MPVSTTDANGIVTKYAYNEAGLVTRRKRLDVSETLTSLGVAYDAAGRLVREGSKTYRYGYLDKVMSVQIDQSDSNSKGTSYFNDALGTTVGSKQGGKYSAAALTAFGESLETLQGEVTSNFKHQTSNSLTFFTGKPYVEGLGHAFLMRNYRAGLAKWQTADPMGYPDGWNQLAYCGNGVTSVVDLWGCVRTHAKHSVGTQEALWTCEQVSWLKYGVTFYGYCDGRAIDYNKEEVKAINGSASGSDTSGITGPLPSREVLEAALNGLEWCEKAAVYKKFSWYEVPNSRKTGKISLSFEVVLTCELTLSYWLTSIVYDKDGNSQKIRTEETGSFTIELTRKTVTFKCKE